MFVSTSYVKSRRETLLLELINSDPFLHNFKFLWRCVAKDDHAPNPPRNYLAREAAASFSRVGQRGGAAGTGTRAEPRARRPSATRTHSAGAAGELRGSCGRAAAGGPGQRGGEGRRGAGHGARRYLAPSGRRWCRPARGARPSCPTPGGRAPGPPRTWRGGGGPGAGRARRLRRLQRPLRRRGRGGAARPRRGRAGPGWAGRGGTGRPFRFPSRPWCFRGPEGGRRGVGGCSLC